MANYCSNCGSEIQPSWKACPTCGKALGVSGQTQLQPQPSTTPPPQPYRPRFMPGRIMGGMNAYGNISVLFGILGFLCGGFFIFGAIAIILGGIGIGKDDNPTNAIGGLILGIINIVCSVIIIILLGGLWGLWGFFDGGFW